MNYNFSSSPTLQNSPSQLDFDVFQKLMKRRVRQILMVSSIYDSFLLAQDGQIRTLLVSEYMDLNLPQAPILISTPDANEALNLLRENKNIDLVITTPHIGGMNVLDFAGNVNNINDDLPVVLLAFDYAELMRLMSSRDITNITKSFIWHGDFKILLSIVKHIEDHWNVEEDVNTLGIQVLLLIEDNIGFYSTYLPSLYTEILKQSQRLITESVNQYHRLLRMRARPKILHATNYEEAWDYYEKYEKYILGVLSDIQFPVNGKKVRNAGEKFCKIVKQRRPDIPVLLQSFQPETAQIAAKLEIGFVRKDSSTLLKDINQFLSEHCGFGEFVFRKPSGEEVGRASNLKELREGIAKIPDDSLVFHGVRDNFSTWLKARTEFHLADMLKPRKVEDYPSPEDLRNDLVQSLDAFRSDLVRGQVADFKRENLDMSGQFIRLGGGSLGGKARGLAFINHLLNYRAENPFTEIELTVPSTMVICTDAFDRFVEENDLKTFAFECKSDRKLVETFMKAEFPDTLIPDLETYLDQVRYPLAVRSSSLLEDSQYQPFAGIYQTYMLQNNHPNPEIRLRELVNAIKRVYASTFSRAAKSYMASTPYRMEEEKMAVIIQKLVGEERNKRFYPDFAGVARSHNFYPTPPLKSEDGVAMTAVGFGQTVVEGGASVRFCPKYPKHLMQFATVEEMLNNAQRTFYALDTSRRLEHKSEKSLQLKSFTIDKAVEDGTMHLVGSTYSHLNDQVYDGLSRRGTPLVTFAPILKHQSFPLPKILDWLLELGAWGMGSPVEIEFAVNIPQDRTKPKQFSVLQLRPSVLQHELTDFQIDEISPERQICHCHEVLGLGKVDNIHDVILVDINSFDRGKSRQIAQEVAVYNGKMLREKRPYLLIGVGRWGSADPWLGIPVTWDQISGAKVIVEAGFRDFTVTPSQGAHFFHNLTSLRIGYFTVNPDRGDGTLDWDWLSAQEHVTATEYVRHLHFDKPLEVLMNGHREQGMILKPEGL